MTEAFLAAAGELFAAANRGKMLLQVLGGTFLVVHLGFCQAALFHLH